MDIAMKNNILIIILTIFLFTNCYTPSKKESSVCLDSLMKQYHDDRMKLFPLSATLAGDDRYNDLLPNNITVDYRKKVKDFYSQYKNDLTHIQRNDLSKNDQMNFDVLLWECNIGLEGGKFNDHLMPINQFWSMHLLIGQLAGGNSWQPFKTVKDYDNWLSRLNAYIEWCDTALVNMRKGITRGITIPNSLVVKIIPQFEALDHGLVEEHLFYVPIKNMPDGFSNEEKIRLSKVYKSIILDKVIPTYKRLKEFLKNEYLPASRTSSGIDAIQDGKEYYSYLIKHYTTTNLSADEIFALGNREVTRLSREMDTVKKQVGFDGDLKAFFEYLRTKKELMPFTEPKQVIAHFNAIHERMKPALDRLFDKTPETPFEVRRTEAFREASASAEYSRGSLDMTRPGIFYVPIPDVTKYNMLTDEDLFLHEAIPGHHYQISLQQENTSLPEFRRLLWYGAYGEGWALYTESLGKELGLYTDPYQYFGMLSSEMHRAIRLVVDVGIHTKGWTREQAIQYSKDHEAEAESSIVSEIERYMAIPGQALSYKVGQLKILELRTKAEHELGDKFDIAQFHNQILDSGCIPLDILEDKIVQWIESMKANYN